MERLEAKRAEIVRALLEVEAKISVLVRAEAPVPMSADDEIESAAAIMRNFGTVLDFSKVDLCIGLNFEEGRKEPKRRHAYFKAEFLRSWAEDFRLTPTVVIGWAVIRGRL